MCISSDLGIRVFSLFQSLVTLFSKKPCMGRGQFHKCAQPPNRLLHLCTDTTCVSGMKLLRPSRNDAGRRSDIFSRNPRKESWEHLLRIASQHHSTPPFHEQGFQPTTSPLSHMEQVPPPQLSQLSFSRCTTDITDYLSNNSPHCPFLFSSPSPGSTEWFAGQLAYCCLVYTSAASPRSHGAKLASYARNSTRFGNLVAPTRPCHGTSFNICNECHPHPKYQNTACRT